MQFFGAEVASSFKHVRNPCDIAATNRTEKSHLVYTCDFEVATFAPQKLHRVAATKIACVNGPLGIPYIGCYLHVYILVPNRAFKKLVTPSPVEIEEQQFKIRLRQIRLRPCLHGSGQVFTPTIFFLNHLFTWIRANSVTDCSGVYTDPCKF